MDGLGDAFARLILGIILLVLIGGAAISCGGAWLWEHVAIEIEWSGEEPASE